MINRNMIQSRLVMIQDYLQQMQRLAAVPRETFLGNADTVAAAESYLRRTLEAVFDISRHIVAKNGGTALATEYKAIAKALGDKKIISSDLSGVLCEMAGYRNRLVHLYHMIENEELYEILQVDLPDIKRFIAEILGYLGGKR